MSGDGLPARPAASRQGTPARRKPQSEVDVVLQIGEDPRIEAADGLEDHPVVQSRPAGRPQWRRRLEGRFSARSPWR